MQVQPSVDRDTAAAQRLGLTPVQPGYRANLDAGASSLGTCPALADRRPVERLDDGVLDQAVTPRKPRYAGHPLLEIVLFGLVPGRPSQAESRALACAATILIVTACFVSSCNVISHRPRSARLDQSSTKLTGNARVHDLRASHRPRGDTMRMGASQATSWRSRSPVTRNVCPPRHRLFQDRDIVVIPHCDPDVAGPARSRFRAGAGMFQLTSRSPSVRRTCPQARGAVLRALSRSRSESGPQ